MRMRIMMMKMIMRLGMRMWPEPSISTRGQNHRKPRANHVTLRFFQQSCARDSEMLILGNSSLIIRW